MQQSLIHVALAVREYDEAIDFYCNMLHIEPSILNSYD